MKAITTNFIDRAAENTIVFISGDYYKLQGFLIKTKVGDNDHVTHHTYPIVGSDMLILDEFIAHDLCVDDIKCCIIGHSGDTVHITNDAISRAIFQSGSSYYNNVGNLLWKALNHGIRFTAEGVDKVIPIEVRKDSEKDFYHLNTQPDIVPLSERHLRKSRFLPIPHFTLGIGSEDKCNIHKLTISELDWALQECIGAYTKYFNLYGISIKLILDKKIEKHHKELLRKFERFFNNRFADWKNLPYCR